jgi:hypothetical protein
MTTLPRSFRSRRRHRKDSGTFIRSQMSQQTLMHPTERFVPLHFYLLHALDLMYDHVREGNALPPSQVISTAPHGRGDSAADRSRHASSADRGGSRLVQGVSYSARGNSSSRNDEISRPLPHYRSSVRR